jgi:hypothetical protein
MKKDCSTLEIDGRTYEFAFGYNELVDAEEVTGCNLQDALERLLGAGQLTCKQLRGMVFAMITPFTGFPKEANEQIKWCGKLIRIDTMQPLREALLEACTIAVSEEYHQKYLAVMAKAKAEAEAAEAAAERLSEEPQPEVAVAGAGMPEGATVTVSG